jgi:chromosome segregation ATPase
MDEPETNWEQRAIVAESRVLELEKEVQVLAIQKELMKEGIDNSVKYVKNMEDHNAQLRRTVVDLQRELAGGHMTELQAYKYQIDKLKADLEKALGKNMPKGDIDGDRFALLEIDD